MADFLTVVYNRRVRIRLNLLIAVMGDSFDTVKAIEDIVAMSHQAQVRGSERITIIAMTMQPSNRRRVSDHIDIDRTRPGALQKIGEYERLLVGLARLTGWKRWKPTNKQRFPRYMEIAQEVIHGD